MSAELRIIDRPEYGGQGWWGPQPGEMWLCPAEKHRIDGRAPCWVIRLPGPAAWWHTNEQATSSGKFWTVTGEPPLITVSPSINIGPEIWHGTITNGVMKP